MSTITEFDFNNPHPEDPTPWEDIAKGFVFCQQNKALIPDSIPFEYYRAKYYGGNSQDSANLANLPDNESFGEYAYNIYVGISWDYFTENNIETWEDPANPFAFVYQVFISWDLENNYVRILTVDEMSPNGNTFFVEEPIPAPLVPMVVDRSICNTNNKVKSKKKNNLFLILGLILLASLFLRKK